jgi:hypothetical protein
MWGRKRIRGPKIIIALIDFNQTVFRLGDAETETVIFSARSTYLLLLLIVGSICLSPFAVRQLRLGPPIEFNQTARKNSVFYI